MDQETEYSKKDEISGEPTKATKHPARITIATGGLLGILAFVFFLQQNFSTIKVSGQSMEPTFHSGDALLASRAYWLIGPIKPNDVVVISSDEPDGEHIIKRVYKLGGDTVDFLDVPGDFSLASGAYVVPDNNVYVLGDNREVSEDSRKFGSVPMDRILGKIVIKKWL